jgi:hypothetical protein
MHVAVFNVVDAVLPASDLAAVELATVTASAISGAEIGDGDGVNW